MREALPPAFRFFWLRNMACPVASSNRVASGYLIGEGKLGAGRAMGRAFIRKLKTLARVLPSR
jgi:hypothetical protein